VNCLCKLGRGQLSASILESAPQSLHLRCEFIGAGFLALPLIFEPRLRFNDSFGAKCKVDGLVGQVWKIVQQLLTITRSQQQLVE